MRRLTASLSVALSLTVSDNLAHLSIDEWTRLDALREFCLVTLLRNVHGIARG